MMRATLLVGLLLVSVACGDTAMAQSTWVVDQPPIVLDGVGETAGTRLRMDALAAARRGPEQAPTESELLDELARLRAPDSSRWYGLITDLGRVGGARALEYLRGRKADLDPKSPSSSDEAEHLQSAISQIQYRQLRPAEQGPFLLEIIGNASDPAFDWAIDEVGDQGLKAALPRIDALIAKSSGTERAWYGLVRRQILAQVRHGRPMACLVASKCTGEGETAGEHAGCKFKIWGYTKLGTVQSPEVIKYLQIALRETEREYEAHLRQRSQTAGLIQIPDKSRLILYYDAIYGALKSLGADPGPRHSRMVIDY